MKRLLGPERRALFVGALGHTVVATFLAVILYSRRDVFGDAAGVAVVVGSVVMGFFLSVTALFVAQGTAGVSLGKALMVSVAMYLGGCVAAWATTTVLLRVGLDSLFNPHIPILEFLTMLLLAVASTAFLVGDYLSGLAAFRLTGCLAGRATGRR